MIQPRHPADSRRTSAACAPTSRGSGDRCHLSRQMSANLRVVLAVGILLILSNMGSEVHGQTPASSTVPESRHTPHVQGRSPGVNLETFAALRKECQRLINKEDSGKKLSAIESSSVGACRTGGIGVKQPERGIVVDRKPGPPHRAPSALPSAGSETGARRDAPGS